MSELCEGCGHRRRADTALIEQLSLPVSSAAARAAIQQKLGEIEADRKLESIAVERTMTTVLTRRPLDHDWCAAQLDPGQGDYFFCDWLTTSSCTLYQCAD